MPTKLLFFEHFAQTSTLRSGQEELFHEWLIEGYPANADVCPAIACFGRNMCQLEIHLHSQAK